VSDIQFLEEKHVGIKERWKRFEPLPENIRNRLHFLNSLFESEGILLAYLFGSLASRKAGEDVDLAFLAEKRDGVNLRQRISDIIGTERIDLVNLRTASPLLRFEIVRTGYLIYKKNEEVENAFELSTIEEYRDTAYLRARQAEMLKQRTKRWC
jgi:predicted nucleotidyltransferase